MPREVLLISQFRQNANLRILRTAAVAIGLMLCCAMAKSQSRSTALSLRPETRPAAELRACGIGLEAQDLIRFLQQGISDARTLPDEPAEKSQLVINAMCRLAELKTREAVPTLQKIAALEPPAGVMQMLEFDLRNTAPDSRDDFRNRALRLLQYNAVNALSLIGDPSSRSVIRNIFSSEDNAAARIQYAICLASLGDTAGVDFLTQVIQRQNRRESAAAARAFTIITGQDFGYSDHTPVRARKARAAMYSQWWRTNRSEFQVDVAAVNERRREPNTAAVYQPRSTRDLLKLASNYFDFNNRTKSWEARRALADAGTSLNSDLERIALDPNEDLDVRMEAMNWFYEANRTNAQSLLKRLRKDENPEIVDKANTLMGQIDDDLHPPTAGPAKR